MGDNFMKHFVDLGLAPDVATAEAAVGAGHLLGFGKPSDVAGAVVYLASDASRWMTGTEFIIDGGYTAI
jgi:NAD(P)-dependent dehydrogenase (short-subunit alcohol dehydrogenase family)